MIFFIQYAIGIWLKYSYSIVTKITRILNQKINRIFRVNISKIIRWITEIMANIVILKIIFVWKSKPLIVIKSMWFKSLILSKILNYEAKILPSAIHQKILMMH